MKLFIGLMMLLLLAGCTSDVKAFESNVISIEDQKITVDCSDEVNRNKEIHNDLGYPCTVQVTEDTLLKDQQDGAIQLDDLKAGDPIEITLAKPLNISKKHRNFEAKEIRLLDQ